MPEKLILETRVDNVLAQKINDNGSLTRAALNAVLPKSTGASASTTQYVRQRTDGTWINSVRDSSVGGRLYVATADPSRRPTSSDGLQAGDVLLADAVYVATFVPSTGAATWRSVAVTGGAGTGPTTPTDPGGPTTPTTPGDTTPPAPTVRPAALLGTVGTWTTTGGSSLITALSDQHLTSASAAPTSQTTGISVTTRMGNFSHTPGNDLVLTLWGASAQTPGDVTVTLGNGSAKYVADMTLQVSNTAKEMAFRWPADEQLSIPVESWRDIDITVSRGRGDLTLADITVQSVPAKVTTDPGTDTTQSTAILLSGGSIWYSNLSSAPLSKSSAAHVTYLRGQAGTSGVPRLDCLPGGDAAPIVMVSGDTPRVNITAPASSTRGDITLMTRTGGVFQGVPIPSTMPAPTNLFKTQVICCPETKQLWELLGLTKSGSTWSAQWGMRSDNYPAWGGVMSGAVGYTGSGLSWTASAVKLAEAKDAAAGNTKAIGHVVGINLPYDQTAPRFVAPAVRSDGKSSDAGAPPAGLRYRLKASFNVDASSLTPIGKAIAKAAQTYGLIVMGGAERLSIICESGSTEQARTGVDPWGSVLNGRTIDNVLAGFPLDQLEAVSPGWGTSGWTAEGETAPTTPTTPTTPAPNPGQRRAIYMNPGVKWLSGASCRGIEKGSEGMGSAYAQWRGEPCYMARCWADQGGPSGGNDPTIASLSVMYSNWHASMDVGPGFFSVKAGESMATAASGGCDARWTATLQNYRKWWASRRNPSQVNAFLSPAHEMNGSWYSWSVNSSNYTQFITAWKRFRSLQLTHFPEALLCFNANRDSSFYKGTIDSTGKGMDWRKMVPGYAEGKVKDFIDVGGVDYYNMDPHAHTASDWASHILQYDGFGAPKGLERHRQFWESQGLPMIIPEWSNNKKEGDSPEFAIGMNNFMRQHAGTGPGKVVADALFNLTGSQGGTYYDGEYAVMGDTVGSPNFAAKYRDLVWGN